MGKKMRPLAAVSEKEKKPGLMDTVREKFAQFESIFLGTASKHNLPFLKGWFLAYFHPAETCESELKNASLKSAAINLLVFYFAFSAMFFVFASLSYYFAGGAQALSGKQAQFNPLSLAPQILVLEPVLNTVFMFVSLSLLFISAKLMGGKATFQAQSYLVSLSFCGIMAIASAFTLLAFAALLITSLFSGFSIIDTLALLIGPLISLFFFLLLLGSFIYGLYSFYRVVKAAHRLSGVRTVGAIACSVALVVLLNVALLIIFSR